MIASRSHRELRVRLTPPGARRDRRRGQRAARPTCRCSTGWCRAVWPSARTGLRAPAGARAGARRAPPRAPAGDRRRRRAGADVDVVVVLTPPAAHAEHRPRRAGGRPPRRRREAARALAGGGRAASRRSPRTRGRHLLAAPFVQLSPTLPRALDASSRDGALGRVHSAPRPVRQRGLDVGGLVPRRRGRAAGRGRHLQRQEPGRCSLGPVVEVLAAEAHGRAGAGHRAARESPPARTSSHAILRHAGGALSSVVASQAIAALPAPGARAVRHRRHREPARRRLGPARAARCGATSAAAWELHEPLDADVALGRRSARARRSRSREGRPPLTALDLDLHLLDVLDAARAARRPRARPAVASTFAPLDLRLDVAAERRPPARPHPARPTSSRPPCGA